MWKLAPEDDYLRQSRKYEKKQPRELEGVMGNLKRYLAALQAGAKPQQIQAGFVHKEKVGVRALDQTGILKGKLAETRLYVYPDEDTETLYLITIGEKKLQGADVRYCEQWVESLRKQKEQRKKEQLQETAQKEHKPDG